tara:strand:+ start:169 stop:924 length:756 start_codon:yes stop_codon:yes gene_type:complete
MSKIPRTALITGSSQGIGKAIAIDFAINGVDVIITSRSRDKLDHTLKELSNYNIKSYAIEADLNNSSDIEKIFTFITTHEISVDILVNNAATIHPKINIIDFDIKEWESVINVNLTSAVRLIQLLLPNMIENQYGKIINMSSIGGKKGGAGRSAYRATKAALISLTESLAAEVKKHGIDVNCICPGSVLTEGYLKAFGNNFHTNSTIPMDKNNMMDPSEIAKICSFLIKDESSAITGAIIDAYGTSNPLFN